MAIDIITLSLFCIEALVRCGLSQADSVTAAEALVLTDTWGVHTHGTKNLRGYIRRIRAGGIKAKAVPRIHREGPAWAMIDGDGALGMVSSTYAMRKAIEKARATGIGYAGLRNSCHFGAAGVYSYLAAKEGLIGIAMSNDIPSVAAPGSRGPVLGSNPFSYAIPVKDAPPILLDIATSTVAGGKVFTAAFHGRSVPEGWIIDEQGRPTTDPKPFPHHATLTPMSGHKGYGIAFLIETLSAIMTGAAIAQHVLSWSFSDPAAATNHGAAFIAIDIGTLCDPEVFNQRLAQTISEIRSAPPAEGVPRVMLPGEIEWERRRQAMISGIDLPDEIMASINQLAEELQMKPL
jgi:ureidoglycolate dehydrogenase (NAD+)